MRTRTLHLIGLILLIGPARFVTGKHLSSI